MSLSPADGGPTVHRAVPRALGWVPPLGWGQTLTLFGAMAAVFALTTRWAIPSASAATGIEPILWWFVLGGAVVFAPLFLLALLFLRAEALDGVDIWRDRLRFRALTARDWRWTFAALVAIGGLSFAAQELLLPALFAEVELHPPFLTLEPLGPGRYWILAAWLPFWSLNILGEEVLWRGVVLPRQEAALGRHAWAANAAGWMLFHATMGPQLVLMLAPIVVILPWVTQRTRNSWVAVIIHAGLNGPGFLAVAFGLV